MQLKQQWDGRRQLGDERFAFRLKRGVCDVQSTLAIANEAGASYRADVNTGLQANATLQSAGTAPATTYAYQFWADTSTGLLKQRNSGNSAWVTIGTLDATNLGLSGPTTSLSDPLARFGTTQNLSIACSVGSSALTIAVKDRAGADATANTPISLAFRNATIGTGDFSILSFTAAHSLVISSGSLMGASNGVAFRLWLVVFNDAGTLRLGAVNCLSGTSIMALKDDAVYSSTAEGGAGAADSAQVIYTGTAVTSKAMRVIGYLEWSSGLAAAGTWSAVPTKIQLFSQGVPLPGQPVQVARNDTSAVATGTTVIPLDDTIPQNTEGDQYMSQAITPTSAANLLETEHQGQYTNSGATHQSVALYQDTTANALKAMAMLPMAAGGHMSSTRLNHAMLAGTTSATTLKIRSGPSSAGTTTFNGSAGGRVFGGVENSYLRVTEVMA